MFCCCVRISTWLANSVLSMVDISVSRTVGAPSILVRLYPAPLAAILRKRLVRCVNLNQLTGFSNIGNREIDILLLLFYVFNLFNLLTWVFGGVNIFDGTRLRTVTNIFTHFQLQHDVMEFVYHYYDLLPLYKLAC